MVQAGHNGAKRPLPQKTEHLVSTANLGRCPPFLGCLVIFHTCMNEVDIAPLSLHTSCCTQVHNRSRKRESKTTAVQYCLGGLEKRAAKNADVRSAVIRRTSHVDVQLGYKQNSNHLELHILRDYHHPQRPRMLRWPTSPHDTYISATNHPEPHTSRLCRFDFNRSPTSRKASVVQKPRGLVPPHIWHGAYGGQTADTAVADRQQCHLYCVLPRSVLE